MLTLTPPAVDAIRGLISKPGTPSTSGLRISHADAAGSFRLTMSAAPDDGDEVIETGGARVFLHKEAAHMLSDRLLNAEFAEDGVVFLINSRDE